MISSTIHRRVGPVGFIRPATCRVTHTLRAQCSSYESKNASCPSPAIRYLAQRVEDVELKHNTISLREIAWSSWQNITAHIFRLWSRRRRILSKGKCPTCSDFLFRHCSSYEKQWKECSTNYCVNSCHVVIIERCNVQHHVNYRNGMIVKVDWSVDDWCVSSSSLVQCWLRLYFW